MRWLLCLTLLAGCTLGPIVPPVDGGASDAGSGDGGGAPGVATLSGPLAFADAGAFEAHVVNGSDGSLVGLGFLISNHGLSCGALEALHGAPVPADFLEVTGEIFSQAAGSTPPPGSYQVLPQQQAGAAFVMFS